MAKTARESAITSQDDDRDGQAGGNNVGARIQFGTLKEWVQALESTDPNLRIARVFSSDPAAPRFVELKYSHPPVEQIDGIDGIETLNGKVVNHGD